MTGESLTCWRLERVIGCDSELDDFMVHILPNTVELVGVGRDPNNYVVCGKEGKSVSRNHLNLVKIEESGMSSVKWKIQSLSKVNGTYVNRVKVNDEEHILENGDLIGVGNNHVKSQRVGDSLSFIYRILGPGNGINCDMETNSEDEADNTDKKQELSLPSYDKAALRENSSSDVCQYLHNLKNYGEGINVLFEDLKLSDSDSSSENIKEATLNYNICGKQGSTKKNQVSHTKSVHVPVEYKCKYCNLMSKYKANIRRHELRLHSASPETKKYSCNRCCYASDNAASVTIHKRKNHPGVSKMAHKVNKIFAAKKVAVNLTQDKCKCGKKRTLLNEMKTCVICKKSMKDLNRHLKEVHGPHDKVCTKCPFKTSSMDRLNKHMKIHSDKSNVAIIKHGKLAMEKEKNSSIVEEDWKTDEESEDGDSGFWGVKLQELMEGGQQYV